MGPARAVETARAWAERALYALLAPHGLTRLVPELRRRHGADALERVRSDPYALTRLPGIGFLLADRVAQGLGVPTSEPRRAAAAAYHLLRDAEDQDHSHLPLDVLTRRAARLLRRRPPEADLRSADAIVTEQDRLYRRVTHQRERWTAAALRALAHSEPTFSAQAAVDTLEGLNAEQRAGLRAALAHRVSVITGGPGTGKTFMADAMCRAAHAARLRVLLCAPTGVAARRLAQSTGGLAAHTLHGALQWRPGQPPFHDSNNPLDADIVWVDESSMLSLEQMHHLVDAIGPDTHLVLVGDADQLGPVGPGRPFADLVATEACKVTKLIELFRQAKRSLLVRAARAVAAGTMPPTQFKSGDEADFFFHRREAPGRDSEARMDAARLLAADVVRVVCERIPARYDLHPTRDLHVLSPVKQPCTRPGHRGPGRRHRLAQHTERAPMLSRNLVYTAMTRASKLCVLVGDEPGVRFALDRADADDRYSTLAERLLGE